MEGPVERRGRGGGGGKDKLCVTRETCIHQKPTRKLDHQKIELDTCTFLFTQQNNAQK